MNGGYNLYRYAPNANAWIDPLGLAKYVVIGEGQASVEAYSAATRKKLPCDEFRTIKRDWSSVLSRSGAKDVREVGSAEWERRALQGNADWIKDRHNEGYAFIDIGQDGAINRSSFYAIEKETLKEVGGKGYKGNSKAITEARSKAPISQRPPSKVICRL